MTPLHRQKLIIETDLGHDPDDYFALCYLHSVGYDIRGILLSIGHPYQVAIAKMFCKEVGLDIPIGVARLENAGEKPIGYNFHYNMLDKHGYARESSGEVLGKDVIRTILNDHSDCDFFVCGPPKSLGAYINENPLAKLNNITFQGGFLGYHLHKFDVERLQKFEGKSVEPTFNLNGAKQEVLAIVKNQNIKSLRFVSKNVCHTVIYDRARHEWMRDMEIRNRADELFLEGMDFYLKKHSEKKFHDPTAACCMKHPEIAKWVKGEMYCAGGGWGTSPNDSSNSETIAAIDYGRLWEMLKTRQ